MIELTPHLLNEADFTPYGEIIDTTTAQQQSINFGLTTRFHDMATVDLAGPEARTLINVFRSNAITFPHSVKVMERHPLGSQAFIPIAKTAYLILVGDGEQQLDIESLKLFYCDGSVGVNYHRNTWHHYQMVIQGQADFLVIDRGGKGNNLEEHYLSQELVIQLPCMNS